MMADLLPCPFCGEIPKYHQYRNAWCVECHSDKCWIVPETDLCSSKEEATEKWNARTPKKKEVKMMAELIIRIKSSDFSEFAGYYHTDESYTKNNEILNEYIRLYRANDDIRCLQIECDRHVSIDTIAYICNQIDEKYFIKTDFSGNNKENKYWLCFHKECLPQERGGEK